MQKEGKQLILAADSGIAAEDIPILRSASARFQDCFTDATSCIVVVEGEITKCQEQIGFARKDVEKLKRQVEEATRKADRLRDECRQIQTRIIDIDSEIERLAEDARCHRSEAEKSENAAIAWGARSLLLVPVSILASVLVAVPPTVKNVVNMVGERSKASDCEESIRDCQRSLRDKENQKSNLNATIRDLAADCNKKENHIGIG
jgi:peptidoglycan hydrolase CwlO-like protein